jgi:hypothetical protein
MNFNNHYSNNYRIVPHIDILKDYSLSFIEGEPVRAKIDHDKNDIFNYENIECSFYCDTTRVQTETGLTINYFNHFDLTNDGLNDWGFSGMTIEDNELINISPEIFEIYKNEDYYKDMYEKQHNLIFNVTELTGNTELNVGSAAKKYEEPIKGFISPDGLYFVDESGQTFYYVDASNEITGVTELTGVTEGEPFYIDGEMAGWLFEGTFYFINDDNYVWLSGGTKVYEEIDTTPYKNTLDMIDYETVIVNSDDILYTPFYTKQYTWYYKNRGTITQTGNTTIHFENHLFNDDNDYEQTGLVLWTEETEQNYFIKIDSIKGYYGPIRQESGEEEINNLIYTDRENKININITDDTIYWVPGNLLVNIKLWNTNGDNKEYNYRLGDLRKSLRKR